MADGRTAICGGVFGAKACIALSDTSIVAWVGAGGVGWRSQVRVDLEAVGLVQDAQCWEVLPCESGVVGGAARDVRSQKSPGPRLYRSV